MVFIPVSPLIPAWDIQCVPELYAVIEKGICRLQARFWLARYIVISYVCYHNEDHSWDAFRFEVGLTKAEDTFRACDRVLQYRMLEAMVKVGPFSDQWWVKPEHWYEACELPRFPPKIDMMAWETRGDGWHSVSVFVGVVEVAPLHPLTGEDLGEMGRKHDLMRYLWHLGGEQT
jgi:hypothetical protein